MAIKFRKKKALLFLSFLLIPLIVSIFLVTNKNSHFEKTEILIYDSQIDVISDPEPPIINLKEYWENDLSRLEKTALNWFIYERDDDIEIDDRIIYSFDIKYSSPNLLGQENDIISIDSDLYVPKSLYDSTEQYPAMLLLHGLYSHGSMQEELAIKLAAEGYIVLTPDLPGHRESEGLEPSIDNLFPNGNFSYKSHPFLSIMASVQGLKLLESLDRVDKSKIGIYGESYGGLIAMYMCGLFPEKISLAVTSLSLGDFNSFDSKSYFFSLMGVSKDDLGTEFWKSETAQIIDPIYYLNNPNTPPIARLIGTNDEIFDINGLDATYYSVQGPKWLQIHPNGHHAIMDHEDTVVYLANHALSNQTAPPNVEKIINEVNSIDFGNKFTIKADINTEISIESVELSFRYKNIVGQPWKINQMERLKNNTWIGTIKHSILTTELEFFIIINLDTKTDKSIWFTTNVFKAGILTSSFNEAFWLMISTILLILFVITLHAQYRKLESNIIETQSNTLYILTTIKPNRVLYRNEINHLDFSRKANDCKRKIRSYITSRTILLMLVQAFI
ncbi:MAG: alpha/beta fold hydrolase, partial [Asgard group archaeon]|nr:alpha/beta fold hydrolase [Asgard group archaeon]